MIGENLLVASQADLGRIWPFYPEKLTSHKMWGPVLSIFPTQSVGRHISSQDKENLPHARMAY